MFYGGLPSEQVAYISIGSHDSLSGLPWAKALNGTPSSVWVSGLRACAKGEADEAGSKVEEDNLRRLQFGVPLISPS